MIEELAFNRFLSQPTPAGQWVVNKPKIRVLFLSIYYPLFMGKYFDRAFRRRDDVDFVSCGTYTGNWIPWRGGLTLPDKYANPPDIPLPFPPNVGRISYDFVKAQLPKDWIPDLVVSCDAGVNWTSKPQDGLVATIATDPHVLDYSHQRKISDKFFNMQLCYHNRAMFTCPTLSIQQFIIK
jgi:hypothetical protein